MLPGRGQATVLTRSMASHPDRPGFQRPGRMNLGPFTLGIKRLCAPRLALDRLPKIDLVLISQAHMDHFDSRRFGPPESRAI